MRIERGSDEKGTGNVRSQTRREGDAVEREKYLGAACYVQGRDPQKRTRDRGRGAYLRRYREVPGVLGVLAEDP